jgi:hypothetical protein
MTGLYIKLYEPNNRDLLNISKFAQNDDFTGIIEYLHSLIPDYINVPNVIDKLYAIIAYRAVFLDDEIRVHNKDRVPVTISLNIILQQLEKIVDNNIYVVNIKDFTIHFKPIDALPGEKGDIYDCIQSISLYDRVLGGYTDIEHVLNKLPVEVFGAINNKVIELYNAYNIVIIPENEKIRLEQLTVNILNEQIQALIISLFKTDLNSIFESMFAFSQHFKNTSYFDLAPLDSRVLENILHRELQDAEKRTQKTPQHSNPLTPFQ